MRLTPRSRTKVVVSANTSATSRTQSNSYISVPSFWNPSRKNTEMKFHQIADYAIATTRSPLSQRPGFTFSIFRAFMKLYLSVCVFCTGTVAAMGSGSGGGGGGGSTESNPLKQEVGSSAFKVYNQGVDLMHAKKFAAAQIKFEQAIRDNPNFAEAHNNLGFTLRQQGPQNYSKALEHYSKAIQLKPSMAETYEYRGVLFAKMGRKADAEKDLAALKKLNPKLAGELEEFLKTGKEEDEYGPTSPKQKS
jgi:tetratricopeptide (TPR) repeat protein